MESTRVIQDELPHDFKETVQARVDVETEANLEVIWVWGRMGGHEIIPGCRGYMALRQG